MEYAAVLRKGVEARGYDEQGAELSYQLRRDDLSRATVAGRASWAGAQTRGGRMIAVSLRCHERGNRLPETSHRC